MIKINITKENSVVKEVKISGHAMFNDYGKDIVCAGVSSILATSINAILSFDDKAITYLDKDDFILTIKKSDEITIKLVNNMINMFKEICRDYPKNITIREGER